MQLAVSGLARLREHLSKLVGEHVHPDVDRDLNGLARLDRGMPVQMIASGIGAFEQITSNQSLTAHEPWIKLAFPVLEGLQALWRLKRLMVLAAPLVYVFYWLVAHVSRSQKKRRSYSTKAAILAGMTWARKRPRYPSLSAMWASSGEELFEHQRGIPTLGQPAGSVVKRRRRRRQFL